MVEHARVPNPFRTFQFDRNDVRLSDSDGEPWFVLADVCRVLEIGNPSDAARRLDDDEKATLDSIEGRPGHGPQSLNIINESGLYSLILTSRKPAARRFKKWVTSQVLPSIRRTGGYGQPSVEQALLEDLVERAVTKALDRRFPRETILHEMKAEKLLTTTQVVEQITMEDRPTHSFLTVIGIRLSSYCHEHGYPMPRRGGRTVYPETAVNAWMENGGRALVMKEQLLKPLLDAAYG